MNPVPYRVRRTAVVMTRIARGRVGVLPDYLIAGTQRGGTTALHAYLATHPDVRRPLRKEIHFFDRYHGLGILWYRAHFPVDEEARTWITGEATPDYMFDSNAPRRIAEHLPNPRAIMLLRNPIDRAYSAWKLMRRRNRDHRAFDEAVAAELNETEVDRPSSLLRAGTLAYLARGRYAEQIRRWRLANPTLDLHIAFSEKLFEKPSAELARLIAFLGLDPVGDTDLPQVHATDSDAMEGKSRSLLESYFKPHNDQLAELLRRDVPWS